MSTIPLQHLEASAAPRQGSAHPALGVLMLLGVVCVIDSAILGSLLTPIKADWGLSDEQLGRLASSFTVAGLVGAPLFALLANRIGRKATLLVGVVLWSVASVASGFAGGFAALLLWRALTGFGEAAYNGLVPSWLADLYRPKWRNLVFSLYMLRNKIGAALALVIGSWVAERYDWQVALWVSGVPGLVLALGLLPLREPRPGQSEGVAAAPLRLDARQSLQVFGHRGFLLHLAALSLFWIAMNGQFWIPAYLHRVYGLSNPQAAGFMAQVLLFTLPAGLIGGYFSSLYLRQRAGGFALFLAVTALIAGATYALAYTTRDLVLAKAGIVVAITTFGASAGALTTLIVETVPPALRATASSLAVVISGGIGGILAPELLGRLSDRHGLDQAIYLMPAAYLAAGVVWLVLAWHQSRRAAPLSPSATSGASA